MNIFLIIFFFGGGVWCNCEYWGGGIAKLVYFGELFLNILGLFFKKTVRSQSPPLIQGRLSYDRLWFCVSVMNLLYSETPSHVKLRNEISM